MKDRFQREIDYLRISVTDRCNLRCFYCMPEDGIDKKDHDDILRDEEIIQAVKAAVKIGLKKVRITGGEPLVRKGIFSLIESISTISGVQEVVMTTNGLLLKGNVKRLKDVGVKRINMSLDTLNPETYKTITKSTKAIDYELLIQELIEHDMLPVKLNAVLLRDINDHEIPDFIALANRYDIHVRFIELMPIGHLNFDYKRHFISKDEILNRYPELEFEQKHLIAETYTIKNKKGKIGFINPISHHFCDQCNRLRLTSDGKLKPCLHTNNEIDIRKLNQQELVEIFKSAIHKKPQKHQLKSDAKPIHRSMNKIGG